MDGFWWPNLKSVILIWTTIPDWSNIAVEEIRKPHIKICSSIHNYIYPKVVTFMWQHRLSKAAHRILEIKPGPYFWPICCFETLTLVLFTIFLITKIVNREESLSLWIWVLYCTKCGNVNNNLKVMLCMNLCISCGEFWSCKKVWYRKCLIWSELKYWQIFEQWRGQMEETERLEQVQNRSRGG